MFWPLVVAVPAVGASPRSVDSLRGANVFDNWLLGGLVVAAPPGGRSPAAHHTVHVAGPPSGAHRSPARRIGTTRATRAEASGESCLDAFRCMSARTSPAATETAVSVAGQR